MGNTRKARFDSRLSALAAERLKTPGYHADGAGLYLQVTETGARSWLLVYRLFGKRREMGLGSFSDFKLAEARERARKYRQLVTDGIDPIEHRRIEMAQRRQEAAQRHTFEQAATEYVNAHKSEWKNAKHRDQWTNTLKAYAYPSIGPRDVAHVTKAEILAILSPLWTTKHETALRLKQRIHAVLDWAAAHDWRRNHNPALWDEIERALPRVSRARKAQHFVACPYADVPKVLKDVRASTATDPVKLLFELVVIAAVRSGEGRGARWSEFDLKAKTWTIPAERMKGKKEHRIPLSPRAVAIVKAARKLAPTNELLFPNGAGNPFSDMTLTALLRRLGHEAMTVHGFRSSFRDWSAEKTSHPREVVEFALAHAVEGKTEAAYFRSDLFERRRLLMTDWAKHCATAEKPE